MWKFGRTPKNSSRKTCILGSYCHCDILFYESSTRFSKTIWKHGKNAFYFYNNHIVDILSLTSRCRMWWRIMALDFPGFHQVIETWLLANESAQCSKWYFISKYPSAKSNANVLTHQIIFLVYIRFAGEKN